MKSIFVGVLLMLSTFAMAQAAPAAGQKAQAKPASPTPGATAPAKPPAEAAKAANVPPDTPVITLNGVCTGKTAPATDCKTVVTRAQFDRLVDALSGGQPADSITPQARRQLATQYSRLLTFAAQAEKQGLETKPETKEMLRFARLQALAQGLTRQLQSEAQPTPAEIQKFYDDNRSKFEEITLDRVMVPIHGTPESKSTPEDLKKLAADVRQRAASGTDFKTLQAEAFQKAGMSNPPETRMVAQPESVPPSQQAILQLKPGEVSQVLEEPTGFYIYKLVKREQVPVDKVRDEIKTALTQQKLQQQVEKVLQSATPTLNNDYFGPATPVPAGVGVHPGAPSQNTPPPPPSPKP